MVYSVLAGVYGWSVVLALAGYAAEYLNRRTKGLTYLTDAVLPVFVVHQPILLIAAFFLFPLSLPLLLEVALLVAVTGAGSLAVYEGVARRWPAMRYLFGLRNAATP